MLLRALLVSLLLAPSLFAQAPHAAWRTIETERFRVHFPAPWEAWATRAAAQLESSIARVEAEVGFTIEEKIDVLVMDPLAVANGSAWPLLGSPRLVLWTNPPEPESVIGWNRDWIEMLSIHEVAHLAHLLRPSRAPLARLTSELLPVGPLAFAPRWVSEGYATVIEGDLTGSGRPHGDFRAAVLRRWAQQGRLPSYDALGSDRASWMGMSMAYLGGSAYLEWLREREGPDSLRRLWARMSAREDRDFEDAFRGVFGDSPDALYRRFTAELTASAIEVERLMTPSLREGELWQDLSWTTEEPHVSPSGEGIVTVLRRRNQPPRLVVLSTGPNSEAEEKEKKRIDEMLEKDPEDVAPVRRKPLGRKPLHEIAGRDGADFSSPRWTADGTSILFTRFEPDAEGFFHADLFRWTPEDGGLERITRFADVRSADPAPDGRRAVAVRNRHGFSELVLIDLATGGIESISNPSIEMPAASPRWSRDGSRIAYMRQEGRWRLRVRELETGRDFEIPTANDALVAQPAWGKDANELYAVVGRRGFLDIQRFDLASGSAAAVTRSLGGSLAPAPAADGSALYFLSIDADGLDLRKLDLVAGLAPLPELAIDPERFAPAVRPARTGNGPAQPVPTPIVDSRPYGVGRQELQLHSAFSWLPSNHAFEIGARIGDVAGRLDTLAIASIPIGDGESGGSIASAWRGWPVELRAQIFTSEQNASEQPKCDDALPGCANDLLDLERTGGEIALSWSRRSRIAQLGVDVGALVQQIEFRSRSWDERVLFARIEPRLRRSFGSLKLGARAMARIEEGETETFQWTRSGFLGGGEIGWETRSLALEWERHSSDGLVLPFDFYAVGGVISSIHPRSALGSRIEAPGLPIGTLVGEEHEAQRARISPGLPVRGFYERHRAWFGDAHGEWLELAGAEATANLAPQPLIKLPALELRLGVARILSGPLHGDTTWWVSTVWRP